MSSPQPTDELEPAAQRFLDKHVLAKQTQDPPLEKTTPDSTLATEDKDRREAEEKLKAEQIEKDRREAEEKLKQNLATEGKRNSELNARIDRLGKGKFGVGYLRSCYADVRPPKLDAADSYARREQARLALDADLKVAETFKDAQLPPLLAAELELGKLGEPLRKVLATSRPDVPTLGFDQASDIARAHTNAARIPAWAERVTAAAEFEQVLAAFDKHAVSRGAAAWTCIVDARASALSAASSAADSGASLAPARDTLLATRATLDAHGPYETVRKRVAAARAKIPVKDGVADYGQWLDMLTINPATEPALSAERFKQGAEELTKAEAQIQACIDFLGALTAARDEFDQVKRLVTPATTVEAGKVDATLQKVLDAALGAGNGFEFTAGLEQLQALATQLAAARKDRGAAVTARAESLLKADQPGKATLDKLKGAKDLHGQDLVAALYLEFGEAGFTAVMNGFKASIDDATAKPEANAAKAAEVAAQKLTALGASLGAAGLKQLTGALGANVGAGATQLGAVLSHGLDEAQAAALVSAYDLSKPARAKQLKDAYATSFRGNPEAFAKFVGKGLAMPGDKGTEAVTRLASMTEAFGNAGDLRTVVDGLQQKDPAIMQLSSGLTGEQTKKLASEQCDAAAERMGRLLTRHFAGDATKLKTPFFDALEDYPDGEWQALRAARQAHQDFEVLAVKDKKGKTPPPVFTAAMQQRLDRLAVTRAHAKPSMAKLVRVAATMEAQGAAGKFAGQGNAAVSEERLEHFAERHTRSMNPLAPPALATASTPVGDQQDKSTTFWPEGVTANDIATLCGVARTRAGKPPGGWTLQETRVGTPYFPPGSGGKFRDAETTRFYQYDMSVDYKMTVGGVERTLSIPLRLGAEIVTKVRQPNPNPKNESTTTTATHLTQFYPRADASLDTMAFDHMQIIKSALGKRPI